MTDTSTSVAIATGEAIRIYCQDPNRRRSMTKKEGDDVADLLRALAAERDEMADRLNALGVVAAPCQINECQYGHITSARRTALEDAAKVCEEQMIIFASDQYATNQPLSSFGERFACLELAKTIRALIEEEQK